MNTLLTKKIDLQSSLNGLLDMSPESIGVANITLSLPYSGDLDCRTLAFGSRFSGLALEVNKNARYLSVHADYIPAIRLFHRVKLCIPVDTLLIFNPEQYSLMETHLEMQGTWWYTHAPATIPDELPQRAKDECIVVRHADALYLSWRGRYYKQWQ
jgi:hypothetical protein